MEYWLDSLLPSLMSNILKFQNIIYAIPVEYSRSKKILSKILLSPDNIILSSRVYNSRETPEDNSILEGFDYLLTLKNPLCEYINKRDNTDEKGYRIEYKTERQPCE